MKENNSFNGLYELTQIREHKMSSYLNEHFMKLSQNRLREIEYARKVT